MKLTEKQRLKKAKLAYRESVWRWLPQKEKKKATGELEIFKKIAEDNKMEMYWAFWVWAKHIDSDGLECRKFIKMGDLWPVNFSHKIPKSRWEKYRLDPDNIEIVSFAFHFHEHNKQILKVYYPN